MAGLERWLFQTLRLPIHLTKPFGKQRRWLSNEGLKKDKKGNEYVEWVRPLTRGSRPLCFTGSCGSFAGASLQSPIRAAIEQFNVLDVYQFDYTRASTERPVGWCSRRLRRVELAFAWIWPLRRE